jgi:anaerobic C4-dicarboxylate transporter|uniref:hypothetical protein n=1 Tax=Aliarcobacter sp. TaxID=2321116 RepID=UPI00404837FE
MCEFYKSMNSFFAKFAMFVAMSSVLIFLLAFLYILFLGIFNEKALNEFDFNDIAMFTLSIIVSFVTAISIIKKYEPNSFLKKI